MSTNGEGGGDSVPRLQPSARLRTGRDPCLVVCGCFSVLTALTAMLCIAVNAFSAVRSFKNGSDIFDGIFRCYAVVIAFIVVIAETEWEFIIRFWKLRRIEDHYLLFILRFAGVGILGRVAVMTRAFPEYSESQKNLILVQNIASYMLLACGVVYVVSGILCIGSLIRARQKKEITRDQAVKDLEELERRREELEQLLLAET